MNQHPVTQRSKKTRQDDSIMATNNSSIVSKRSVERLYYPEPHFYRYFVKKPQRRSPLINRGYWLRMHAVDYVIRRFLDEPTEKPKVVMNLGCGYDPLPFQWLAKDNKSCRNVTFVDIDYPQLMTRKCEVIVQTPELLGKVGQCELASAPSPVLLRSEHYLALGCDLRDLKKLGETLNAELDVSQCMFLLTAEVSVTYMDVRPADDMIAWAAQFNDVRFCLLEQYLPNGIDHPFAQTMMRHFEKLQTPLKSVHHYPRLADQHRRFKNAGWSSVVARSLWDLWSDSDLLTASERVALNSIEPFDEWEDFALFASHYFLLVALHTPSPKTSPGSTYIGEDHMIWKEDTEAARASPGNDNSTAGWTLQYHQNLTKLGSRRYGAAFPMQEGVVGHHGGLGMQSRLSTTNVYALEDPDTSTTLVPPLTMSKRMCHTITAFANSDCLVVGGRTSPDCALADCWLFRSGIWKRIEDLPTPLYRHCASPVTMDDGTEAVLIYGGRTNNGITISEWLLWRDSLGWVKLECMGKAVRPRFGAALTPVTARAGLLIGGMSEEGVIHHEIFNWAIDLSGDCNSVVVENKTQEFEDNNTIGHAVYRFGGGLEWCPAGLLLIGGLSNKMLLQNEQDILGLMPANRDVDLQRFENVQPFRILPDHQSSVHPLMLGHSAISAKGTLAILGGGAVCFSFGTFWNEGAWTLERNSDALTPSWHLIQEQTISPWPDLQAPCTPESIRNSDHQIGSTTAPATIQMTNLATQGGFGRIVNASLPVVIENVELGRCTKLWSLGYLKAVIGADRSVIVHEALDQNMNFQEKNFNYVTKPFGTFIDDISAGAKQYLRSLASEQPADKPAAFATDYPEIANDFKLPPELDMADKTAHSSVLRISGPVTMWLHYDVMANVLCQIHGTKKLILYPPADVLHLEVPPGASSSAINVFGPTSSSALGNTHPQQAILHPGDILFIPPLWLHAACPTEGTSIAVNVFFRNLHSGYAAGRDVYGNRDLQAYEKGRHDIKKMAKAFDRLPSDMSQFYLERLAEELKGMARSNN